MAELRIHFHESLDSLKRQLYEMGVKAENAVELAVKGYTTRDADLCSQVFLLEKEINAAERAIDDEALELLASQQPMAVDLRLITSCMKINSDLERVGDQAVNIAQLGIDDMKLPQVMLPVDISRMGAAAVGMVRHALNAFEAKDAELADAVLKMDDIVDRMDDDAWRTLVSTMHESHEVIGQALGAITVSRNLERVADHATNIAEDVIFWVRGTDVRHGSGQAN